MVTKETSKTYCDRCNKEVIGYKLKFIEWLFNLSYVERVFLKGIEIKTRRIKKVDSTKDLCEDCYRSFKRWWFYDTRK